MKNELLTIGLIQFIIVLVISTGVFYLILKLLKRSILEKYDIQLSQTSFGILASGIIFCTGYLMSGITTSISHTIRLLNPDKLLSFSNLTDITGYTFLYVMLALVASHLIIWTSLKLFTYLTINIDEFEEIKNNNLSVALITATIIVATSLIMKDSVDLLIESFVPYPELKAPLS